MKDINTLMISGLVVRDAEYKEVGARQTPLATFTLLNVRETSFNGESRKETGYYEVKLWGELATEISSQLRKDTQVVVQGRLRVETWDDKQTGDKKTKTVINADAVLVNGTATYTPAPAPTPRPQPTKPAPPPFPTASLDVRATVVDESIDDIPFRCSGRDRR